MQNQVDLEIVENKSDATVLNDEYYESNNYLQLIPQNNPKWIYSPLNFDDEFELIGDEVFEPTDLDKSHKHYQDIQDAFDIFNDLNQWPLQAKDDENSAEAPNDKSWKLHSSIKKDDSFLTVYTAKNSRFTKSEMTFPFSSAIIAGILCNNEHHIAMDENILSSKILKQFDANSYCVHASTSKPFPFSSNRDVLMVRFCYIFENGQFVFGEKSINDQDLDIPHNTDNNNNNSIRAEVVNLWYVRPCGEDNNHCRMSHYCSYNPNGGFSKFLLQKIKMDKAKYLLKLYEYIMEIQNILHTEGQLYIPSKLFNLMNVHESLVRPNGEDIRTRSDSLMSAGSNDDNVIDLNLAVQSVICDVKGFLQDITSN